MRARLVLSSDVRACVTGCVRVYGLSGVGVSASLFDSALLCTFLLEAVNFVPLFVCHVKFSTILASIVGYETGFANSKPKPKREMNPPA